MAQQGTPPDRFVTYTDLRDFLDRYTSPEGVIQGDPATIAGEAATIGLVDQDDNFRRQIEGNVTDQYITCPTRGDNAGRYLLVSPKHGHSIFYLSHADALRAQQDGVPFKSWYTLDEDEADRIAGQPRVEAC